VPFHVLQNTEATVRFLRILRYCFLHLSHKLRDYC
jgi:hypothetical protein